MSDSKFFENMTYEEWSSKQNSDSFEFKIVQGMHRSFPDWNLEEIKKHSLDFISSHLNIIQDIRSDHDNHTLDDIEKIISDYILSCRSPDNNLESHIIKEVQKIYSGWTLDDIKRYVPGFISNYLRLIQNVSIEHPNLNIGDIEKFIFDYVEICKTNNNIYIETFGSSPVNINHLSKWNSTIGRITKIIFDHPGGGHIDRPIYKPKDKQGHSSSYKVNIGKQQYSIRADQQLGRDIAIIRADHKHRFETEPDLLRELIFKGVAIYTLINQDSLKEGGHILLSMERRMSDESKLSREQRKEDVMGELGGRLEYLKEVLGYRNEQDRNALLDNFRDNLHEYLKQNLNDFVGSIDLKIMVKTIIMENEDLEVILRKLEDNKLISKEYTESIFKKGVTIPFLNIINDEE